VAKAKAKTTLGIRVQAAIGVEVELPDELFLLTGEEGGNKFVAFIIGSSSYIIFYSQQKRLVDLVESLANSTGSFGQATKIPCLKVEELESNIQEALKEIILPPYAFEIYKKRGFPFVVLLDEDQVDQTLRPLSKDLWGCSLVQNPNGFGDPIWEWEVRGKRGEDGKDGKVLFTIAVVP